MNIYVRPNKVERMNAIIKWSEVNADENYTREELVDKALDAYLTGIEETIGIGSN